MKLGLCGDFATDDNTGVVYEYIETSGTLLFCSQIQRLSTLHLAIGVRSLNRNETQSSFCCFQRPAIHMHSNPTRRGLFCNISSMTITLLVTFRLGQIKAFVKIELHNEVGCKTQCCTHCTHELRVQRTSIATYNP
jgi:hypothetical protein